MAPTKKTSRPRGAMPPEEMRDMPKRFRKAMEIADNITQQSLAEASGVSQAVVSSLATGITLGSITVTSVARMAKVLNVDLNWLILNEGDVVPRLVTKAKAGELVVLDEDQSEPLVPRLRSSKNPKPRKRFPRQI